MKTSNVPSIRVDGPGTFVFDAIDLGFRVEVRIHDTVEVLVSGKPYLMVRVGFIGKDQEHCFSDTFWTNEKASIGNADFFNRQVGFPFSLTAALVK